MNALAEDFPHLFLNVQETPCISLYQPTNRSHPDNEQDPIRFKNLIKKIETSLESKYSSREIQDLMKPFHDLLANHHFWNHSNNGLAVFATPNLFKVYPLPRSTPELAVVANSFHIKPLIRIMQTVSRFQLLELTRYHIKLYEGDRDELKEITLHPNVPETIEKALGHELTEPHLTVASYGMGTQGPPMHHGQGGRKDDKGLDAKRYFQKVDEAITQYHSRLSKLPLILATLPEYHHVFHSLSKNDYLLPEDIKANPEELSLDELRARAWAIIEPYYSKQLHDIIQKYNELCSHNQGSDDLNEVAMAALAGRIDTILIDEKTRIPGQLNHESGECTQDDTLDPETDDLLDDIGELVLKANGTVIIVPQSAMPTESGLAAIYRY